MNSKILVINGATRSNGNTDILVKSIQEGGAAIDLDIDLVILREKQIENCIGCYQCLEKAICSIQDDMEEIRTLIEKAKILVLASPMYWCGVTGLMKTFIDRDESWGQMRAELGSAELGSSLLLTLAW